MYWLERTLILAGKPKTISWGKKACCNRIRSNDLLFIDKHILKDSESRNKKFIHHTDKQQKSTNDIFPQMWIIECVKCSNIKKKNCKLHHKNYGKQKSKTISWELNISGSETPKRHPSGKLILATTIYILTMILRKCKEGFRLNKKR